VPTSRTHGSIPQLPNTPAWRAAPLKAQGQLYLMTNFVPSEHQHTVLIRKHWTAQCSGQHTSLVFDRCRFRLSVSKWS